MKIIPGGGSWEDIQAARGRRHDCRGELSQPHAHPMFTIVECSCGKWFYNHCLGYWQWSRLKKAKK